MKNKFTFSLNYRINSKIVICCLTSLLLAYSTAALGEYKPPRTQRPPGGYTSTTGTRGECEGVGETSLRLLAPINHVGQTASLYPTFAWFVPQTKSLPIEFRLYKYGSNGQPQLQNKWKLQSNFGVMTLSLPKDKPGLERGQRYIWQVAMLCDSNRPSNDLVAMAEIDVVEMPGEVGFVGDARTNVDILAEAGLWYDAISEAFKTGQRDAINDLLKNLATLENPEITATSTSQRN